MATRVLLCQQLSQELAKLLREVAEKSPGVSDEVLLFFAPDKSPSLDLISNLLGKERIKAEPEEIVEALNILLRNGQLTLSHLVLSQSPFLRESQRFEILAVIKVASQTPPIPTVDDSS